MYELPWDRAGPFTCGSQNAWKTLGASLSPPFQSARAVALLRRVSLLSLHQLRYPWCDTLEYVHILVIVIFGRKSFSFFFHTLIFSLHIFYMLNVKGKLKLSCVKYCLLLNEIGTLILKTRTRIEERCCALTIAGDYVRHRHVCSCLLNFPVFTGMTFTIRKQHPHELFNSYVYVHVANILFRSVAVFEVGMHLIREKCPPYTYPNPTQYFIFNYLIIFFNFIRNKCFSDVIWSLKRERKKKFTKRQIRTQVHRVRRNRMTHASRSTLINLIVGSRLL